MSPVAINAADLLTDDHRELILIAGKDGVGKSSALVSLADFVAQMWPDQNFFVLDMENKFRPTLQSYGTVPKNIVYYQCETINDLTESFDEIMANRRPNDWLAAESGGRIWERAQDLGYQAIQGMTKAAWMEKRRQTPAGQKQPPVTPKPDDLWSVIKGAHDGAFLDVIAQTNDLNFVMTTGVGRVKEARSNRKENQDRVDFRNETGIDLNLEGAPRLPYYALSGMLLERQGGSVSCRIWRDNGSKLDDPAITFAVPTRKDWAQAFFTETGRL